MKLKTCLVITVLIMIPALIIFYFLHSRYAYYDTYTTIHVDYTYLSRENLTLPITLDPHFKYGTIFWGISTPNNGSQPIYMDMYWITHSKDLEGFFRYSSIIQGCKPYNWGCGNYIFKPVPASEKFYLSTSIVKETRAVYRKEGFTGALVDLWFENFKGDALVIDLYLARDVMDKPCKSVEKGFVQIFTHKNQYGRSYHFIYVLTEARNGEEISLHRLLLEPIVDMAFNSFGLDRSEWWLVSVDAGAEAYFSEVTVYIYMLEVGRVVVDQ